MMIGGMGVEAMPDRGWKRKFDEPIPLPAGGRELVTLEDAKGSDRSLISKGKYCPTDLPRGVCSKEQPLFFLCTGIASLVYLDWIKSV
jgi:hypothetical protein